MRTTLIILAVLLSAVMPHHHHGGLTCFAIEICAADHVANDEHTHHSHGDDNDGCRVRQLYVVEAQHSNNDALSTSKTPHDSSSSALPSSTIGITTSTISGESSIRRSASKRNDRPYAATALRAPPTLL